MKPTNKQILAIKKMREVLGWYDQIPATREKASTLIARMCNAMDKFKNRPTNYTPGSRPAIIQEMKRLKDTKHERLEEKKKYKRYRRLKKIKIR